MWHPLQWSKPSSTFFFTAVTMLHLLLQCFHSYSQFLWLRMQHLWLQWPAFNRCMTKTKLLLIVFLLKAQWESLHWRKSFTHTTSYSYTVSQDHRYPCQDWCGAEVVGNNRILHKFADFYPIMMSKLHSYTHMQHNAVQEMWCWKPSKLNWNLSANALWSSEDCQFSRVLLCTLYSV